AARLDRLDPDSPQAKGREEPPTALRLLEPGPHVYAPDREAVRHVEEPVHVVGVRVAHEDGVDPAHAFAPEIRRRDARPGLDPPAAAVEEDDRLVRAED